MTCAGAAFGDGTLFLTASIGTQATDLVATPEEASDVKVVPSANWNQYPKEFSPGRVTWSFTLPDEILKAKDSASLTLTDFECHTDPGKAELTLRVTVTGYDEYTEKLEVEKKATDALQILFFKADPPSSSRELRERISSWSGTRSTLIRSAF